MVVSTATTFLLAPLQLVFLVPIYLSKCKQASKAQPLTPSGLTTVNLQSYCLETCLQYKSISTAPGSKPNRGNTSNYQGLHARHQVSSLSSKATLIFLAPKILRKIPIILWTLGHLFEQKYFTTLWNILATENKVTSGQKWQFLQQLPFYQLHCSWFSLCLFTLVRDSKTPKISP